MTVAQRLAPDVLTLAAIAAGVLVGSIPVKAAPEAQSAAPTIQAIQVAYERQAAAGEKRHDKDLELVAADCSRGGALGQQLCWVTFTTRTNPERPLYYDVAVVEWIGDAWDLKSGLCKR